MADEYILAATKIGHDVQTETDLNEYVFHSNYNTFKIIKTGTATFNLAGSTNNQQFTIAHELDFIPLVTGFARRAGTSNIITPNTNVNVGGFSSVQVCILGIPTHSVFFEKIAADDTNVIFTFDNSGSATTVTVRYYCLEKIT